jgi:hypothetical protein
VSRENGTEPQAPSGWQLIELTAPGFVNFGELYGHADHISAYAQLRVYSPQQQDVAVMVGSDDQCRLWLNGKQIHECLQVRMPFPRRLPADGTHCWPAW